MSLYEQEQQDCVHVIYNNNTEFMLYTTTTLCSCYIQQQRGVHVIYNNNTVVMLYTLRVPLVVRARNLTEIVIGH